MITLSSSDESKTDNDEENNDADSISEIEENDEQFFQVLQITEDSPRDFDSIKSIYRKKLHSTILIKSLPWDPKFNK